MSLILRKIPSTWYRYDVQFSIELLQAYIDGAEQQALDSIETFRKEKTTHVFEEAPEEGSGRIVETHKGLDDETWDPNTVFETYFPNLQRRSTLITVYSFLEHELGELCNLFIRIENLAPEDLSRAGIDQLTTFLIRTVGLQIDKTTGAWKEIKNIQKIRNLIVHNNGKLEDQNGGSNVSAIRYVATCPYLSGDDEIDIHNGYLSHVLQTFARQFQEIDRLIAARESN